MRRAPACLVLALLAGTCSRPAADLSLGFVPPAAGAPASVRVAGLTEAELTALASLAPDDATWPAILAVRVAGGTADQPAIAGRFAVSDRMLTFRPMFPFDAGRTYRAEFARGRIPGATATERLDTSFALPADVRTPTTVVQALYPSGDEWPENLLRLYIQFSGPMGRANGVAHVRLLDEAGREVVDPFLPIEADLWNSDYTRFTVFLDPGRVKRGILPNEQMGRAVLEGRTYTIEVSGAWRDQHGQPLAAPYRRTVRISAPDEHAVTPAEWRIETPAPGTRDPLTVRFPDALDHGLLQRAIGVARGGSREPVAGQVTIDAAETVWRLTPESAWVAGDYDLVIYSILEDPSGNRVGRLFEVDRFDAVDRSPTPERSTRRFRIAPPASPD